MLPTQGRDNQGERLRESQENGGKSREMTTGPEEDMGITSGRNDTSKMGSAGVHRSRSTGKQAGIRTLDATLRSMAYESRETNI